MVANKIEVMIGVIRELNSQTKTYFWGVKKDKVEIGLHEMKSLEYINSKQTDPVNGRSIHQVYLAPAPIKLKMFSTKTKLGRAAEYLQLYFLVNPTSEKISFTGLDGWGKFIGRGKLLLTESSFVVLNNMVELNLPLLKELINYKVVGPPITKSKKAGKKTTAKKAIRY